MRIHLYVAVIFLIVSNFCYVYSEIVTMSLVGSAIVASGFFGWDSIKSNTLCRYMECCSDTYIPYNLQALKQSLEDRMFGQPLVYQLVNILKAHKEALRNEQKRNKKALVISLHGWSGVGKNYATSMIAEALYKNGMKSNFVKVFMGKKDFSCTHTQKAQDELLGKIKKIVSKCPTSLIVFDEIHEMCPSVLDIIKPLLDHHHAVDGVDYRDSIFIFISNIGGTEIATHLLEMYNDGIKRNDLQFHDFEPLIRRTAYKTGGFDKSSIIAQHLIDYYIPFLPLEQLHVETCALAEFRSHGIYNPTKEMMQDALSVISYGPSEDQKIFANNGCKRFSRQIPYVIQKHNKTRDEL